MRLKYLVTILILLALAVSASPVQAGGIVSVCDQAHLLTALAGGGTVTFSCSGTIILTAEITIVANTTIDGSGQDCHDQRQPRSAGVCCECRGYTQPESS